MSNWTENPEYAVAFLGTLHFYSGYNSSLAATNIMALQFCSALKAKQMALATYSTVSQSHSINSFSDSPSQYFHRKNCVCAGVCVCVEAKFNFASICRIFVFFPHPGMAWRELHCHPTTLIHYIFHGRSGWWGGGVMAFFFTSMECCDRITDFAWH